MTTRTPRLASLTTEVVQLDPATAEKWLAKNGHNRPVRSHYVNRLIRSMAQGEWRLTGEAIKFDRRGNLIDGQHRLIACKESGATIPMLIVRGINQEAQEVMDAGVSRSVADALRFRGIPNSAQVAAMLRLLVRYRRHVAYNTGWTSTDSPTHSESLSMLNLEPGILESVPVYIQFAHNPLCVSPTAAGVAHHVLNEIDSTDAEFFFQKFNVGDELPESSPIFALRRRFADRNRFHSQHEHLALIFKAWNAWRDGKEMRTLVWRCGGSRPESFPLPH